ncbi:hypothetical protein B0T17DRAFT_616246 [Bombardia bombarda]|uniref:Cut9 interacting protein Scn1 n=1 Tax=Bombardia bombarda TaxID=252184 RepID=A0AA39XCA1_9PEZI|nr:hypothetical protein B0T17DRAFT_616246 [Bombardia bombarda]
MSSTASIGAMRARVLTIMATRAQDQDLVASVAAERALKTRAGLMGSASAAIDPSSSQNSEKVVPAFGWHPWFSYQLYDEDAGGAEPDKTNHYTAVLTPAPDAEFIASLPDPQSLNGFISKTRERLLAEPTALVGEVGLDRAFRLPWGWNGAQQSERDEKITPGGREGRTLSPYHVKMPHQVLVLKAQLRLAGELGRPVSVHGVQAHGVVFDALASLWKGHEKEVISKREKKLVAKGAEDFSSSEDEEDDYDDDDEGWSGRKAAVAKKPPPPYQPKPFPPRICLHSFSGPPQMVSQYLNPAIPARMFFSFSMVVNLSTAGGESKFADVIRACPDDQILVESDLHTAGEDMDHYLEQMCRRICDVKGWTLVEGLERLRKNYEEFIFG